MEELNFKLKYFGSKLNKIKIKSKINLIKDEINQYKFLLIIFQEIIYVLTIHIIAYAVFPKLKSKIPEPPEVMSGFVDLNL